MDILEMVAAAKESGKTRAERLRLLAKIEGVYVPSLYEVSYNDDNTIQANVFIPSIGYRGFHRDTRAHPWRQY